WSNKFQFPDLISDQRRILRSKIVEKCSIRSNLLLLELEFLKILSRDLEANDDLGEWPSFSTIELLTRFAGYQEKFIFDFETENQDFQMAIINESQKCLCNFVFQYENARDFC
uniref:Uncharacterized protein n=1 Tax=Romanomermis culicivorax TaxID=13658 RepID=A0A915JJS7_ROMCU